MAQNQERNQEATVYVGNLDEKVTDTLLWELMLQAGPVGKNGNHLNNNNNYNNSVHSFKILSIEIYNTFILNISFFFNY